MHGAKRWNKIRYEAASTYNAGTKCDRTCDCGVDRHEAYGARQDARAGHGLGLGFVSKCNCERRTDLGGWLQIPYTGFHESSKLPIARRKCFTTKCVLLCLATSSGTIAAAA